MMITIWVFVLDSEIHNAWIEWDVRPQTDWIQVQINYSTYLRLKEA